MISSAQRASRRTALGRRGEAHAAHFYRQRGATIIAANVRYAVGELDLVVREADGTIVFVEVKTRTTVDFGLAEAVDRRKLTRMRKAAVQWLDGQPLAAVRFDVVALLVSGEGFLVEHYEGVE